MDYGKPWIGEATFILEKIMLAAGKVQVILRMREKQIGG